MTIIPHKRTFRLYFRNKTNTRKTINSTFRLRQLLKKDLQKSWYKIKTKNEQIDNTNNHSFICGGYIYKSTYYKIKEPITDRIDSFANMRRDAPNAIEFLKKNTRLMPRTTKRIKANLTGFRRKSRLVLSSDTLFLKENENYKIKTSKLLFGRYGICFEQYGVISSKCVETVRLSIAQILRKKGRVWVRICCDTPVSARPPETRMGKGKGAVSYWGAKVYPGQFFLEFTGITKSQLQEIYRTLCQKSVVNLKIVE